jgi:hypothetical protein
MKDTFIFLGVLALALAGTAYLLLAHNGNLGAVNPLALSPTNASTTVNTTSTKILDFNSEASFRCITNLSTNTLYLWFRSTTTAATGFTGASGLAVASLSSYCMSDAQGNLWNGPVYGLMSTFGASVGYSQF